MFHYAVLVWTTGTRLSTFGTEFYSCPTGPLAHEQRVLDAVTGSSCNKRPREIDRIQSSVSENLNMELFIG
jgi:hypothetical protein